MEELVAVLGLLFGLASVATTFGGRIRFSFKNTSIKIRFGHKIDDPEVRIADINHLSDKEIDLIERAVKSIEMEDGGVKRRD